MNTIIMKTYLKNVALLIFTYEIEIKRKGKCFLIVY